MFSWQIDRTFLEIGQEGERKKEIKDQLPGIQSGNLSVCDPTNDGVHLRKELVESQT